MHPSASQHFEVVNMGDSDTVVATAVAVAGVVLASPFVRSSSLLDNPGQTGQAQAGKPHNPHAPKTCGFTRGHSPKSTAQFRSTAHYSSPKLSLTTLRHRLRNSLISSLHIFAASTFAGLSSFGLLNMLITDSRIVSGLCTGLQRSAALS